RYCGRSSGRCWRRSRRCGSVIATAVHFSTFQADVMNGYRTVTSLPLLALLVSIATVSCSGGDTGDVIGGGSAGTGGASSHPDGSPGSGGAPGTGGAPGDGASGSEASSDASLGGSAGAAGANAEGSAPLDGSASDGAADRATIDAVSDVSVPDIL